MNQTKNKPQNTYAFEAPSDKVIGYLTKRSWQIIPERHFKVMRLIERVTCQKQGKTKSALLLAVQNSRTPVFVTPDGFETALTLLSCMRSIQVNGRVLASVPLVQLRHRKYGAGKDSWATDVYAPLGKPVL